MADAATSDWSSGSTGSWAQPSGMWGAPTGGYGGYQSPYGGMQSPYSSPYGGFGGGMPYGGGYPMQSPYGAPQGYGGGYSPYGMQSPYGAYGMPQQQMGAPQTMQATGEAAPAAPLTTGEAEPEPQAPGTDDGGNYNIKGGSFTRPVPWEPLGEQYEASIFPNARREYQRQVGTTLYDDDGKVIGFTPGLGPLGFDPSSEAALSRIEAITRDNPNALFQPAWDATRDVTTGQSMISTGNEFGDLYRQPGITNAGQYSEMYQRPGFTVDPYADLYRRDAVSNADQYSNMIRQDAIGNTAQYNQAAAPIGAGQFEDIYSGARGQGSLAGGMFGQIARGDLVNGNPFREQAIEDAMAQTSDEVKSTMSARGRFGSDAYGDAMGRALGQVATQARMQGYDTDTANLMAAAQARSGEALQRQGIGLQAATGGFNVAAQNRANQLAAAQGISSLQGTNAAQRLAQIQGLSGVQGQNYQAQMNALQGMNAAEQMAASQRMAAAQGLTGVQGQNWQNQLGALQGLTDVQGQNLQNRLQAAGMAPTMQQLRFDDTGRLLQAGAAREAMAQQQRNFTWDQLANYRGMLGNLPGAAGSETVEQDKPWWQTALGVAGTIGGMFGGLNLGGG